MIPGARVAPLLTVTAPPMLPLPPRVPPVLAVTVPEPVPEPVGLLTRRVPPLTVVLPLVLLAPLLWQLFSRLPEIQIGSGWLALTVAGLLVGVGTRYGAGCTSGHGVCGLAGWQAWAWLRARACPGRVWMGGWVDNNGALWRL